MIYEFWELLAEQVTEIVDQEEIVIEDLSKDSIEATQQRLQEKMSVASENLMQLQGEKIQAYIEQSLGKEAERLKNFNNKFVIGVEEIQLNFNANPKEKQDLWKGAVRGGSTALSGALGISSLAFMLHIPISIPIVVIVASIGTITGKFALDAILLGEKVSRFKKDIKRAILKQLKEVEVESDFTQQVRLQVNEAFGTLEKNIDQEVEGILLDTQKTLVNLKIQIAEQQLVVENTREKYENMLAGIQPMIERATKLNQQVAQ